MNGAHSGRAFPRNNNYNFKARKMQKNVELTAGGVDWASAVNDCNDTVFYGQSEKATRETELYIMRDQGGIMYGQLLETRPLATYSPV